MKNSYILPSFLMLLLLFASQAQNAAEVAPIEEKDTADKKEAVEISPTDPTAAGKAKHAFKEENPCEGMEKGEFFGPETCAE